ncbi:unnamed protein product [Ectocarpus fasciculatus]
MFRHRSAKLGARYHFHRVPALHLFSGRLHVIHCQSLLGIPTTCSSAFIILPSSQTLTAIHPGCWPPAPLGGGGPILNPSIPTISPGSSAGIRSLPARLLQASFYYYCCCLPRTRVLNSQPIIP